MNPPAGVSSIKLPSDLLMPLKQLADCTCCPRDCHADRLGGKFGYCNVGAGFSIGAICAHRGEEPPIMGDHGICNIFFSRCNMACRYCQNWQISRARGSIINQEMSLDEVISQIESIMSTGCRTVGFVSPSHVIPQVQVIINALKARGSKAVFVYNTSSYDKAETIRAFDGQIDVWLPDLKYLDEEVGMAISDTPNYPAIATAAIREMFRQKGSSLLIGEDGYIESGLIIRHLVLPGKLENSKAVLRWIARELSHTVHVSLMSQYHPTARVKDHPDLGRTLHPEEYAEIVDYFHELGFYRGWTQDVTSPSNYKPDFEYEHPFEFDPSLDPEEG